MALHIAIIGSGPTGMTAALLLARQGHRITLVDRDPGPVAGRPWERVGVMQFHLPHSLRAPGRIVLAERLPDVHAALVAAGAEVRAAPGVPEAFAGLHARRSVLERTIWECTTREPGVRRLVDVHRAVRWSHHLHDGQSVRARELVIPLVVASMALGGCSKSSPPRASGAPWLRSQPSQARSLNHAGHPL